MHPLDRDGEVLWGGSLPAPIAYRIFTDEMQEKHGDCYIPEVQRLMIMSALARGDRRSAEIYFIDTLAGQKGRKVIRVSKFSPGQHFYVGREKFDSLEAAQKHAESRGYLVLPGIDVQSMNDLILAAREARKKL
jgi:hypothetical protein